MEEENIKQQIEDRMRELSELENVEETLDEKGVTRLQTIPPEMLPPVFLNGEPFCIIDEQYVPYDEAQIIFQEKKLKYETLKLEVLKEVLKKNQKVKNRAEKGHLKAVEEMEAKREKERTEEELMKEYGIRSDYLNNQ